MRVDGATFNLLIEWTRDLLLAKRKTPFCWQRITCYWLATWTATDCSFRKKTLFLLTDSTDAWHLRRHYFVDNKGRAILLACEKRAISKKCVVTDSKHYPNLWIQQMHRNRGCAILLAKRKTPFCWPPSVDGAKAWSIITRLDWFVCENRSPFRFWSTAENADSIPNDGRDETAMGSVCLSKGNAITQQMDDHCLTLDGCLS